MLRRRARPFRLALMLVLALTGFAEAEQRSRGDAGDVAAAVEAYRHGLDARARGNLSAALPLLERAHALDPGKTLYGVTLAETLGWAKRFAEAEATYRDVLERVPGLRTARLGLAQVVAWQRRFGDAQRLYAELVAADARDLDARRGLAATAYWAGDLRVAAREFRRVLAMAPGDEEARRSLAEIEAASAPQYALGLDRTSDDQPYRIGRGGLRLSYFSDPLTRWDLEGGASRLEVPGTVQRTLPWGRIGVQATVEGVTLRAHVGALHSADVGTIALGGAAATLAPRPGLVLGLEGERRELLATAASLRVVPTVDEGRAHVEWTGGSGLRAAAEGSLSRYSDDNTGGGVWAYVLLPVLRTPVRLLLGPSLAYRDTSESRFRLESVHASRAGGAFVYDYTGVYDPYWSPHQLVEARGVGALEWSRPSGAVLNVHLDGGWARDQALMFGPASGPTPMPPSVASAFTERTFYPWRLTGSASFPLGRRHRLRLEYEHDQTVFYRADGVHASLDGRF